MQRCTGLRLLDLLTHNSWKVDVPCPLNSRETIITHFCKQLPHLKVRPTCRMLYPEICERCTTCSQRTQKGIMQPGLT